MTDEELRSKAIDALNANPQEGIMTGLLAWVLTSPLAPGFVAGNRDQLMVLLARLEPPTLKETVRRQREKTGLADMALKPATVKALEDLGLTTAASIAAKWKELREAGSRPTVLAGITPNREWEIADAIQDITDLMELAWEEAHTPEGRNPTMVYRKCPLCGATDRDINVCTDCGTMGCPSCLPGGKCASCEVTQGAIDGKD